MNAVRAVFQKILSASQADIPGIADLRKRTFSYFAPQSYSQKEVETLLNDFDENHLADMIKDQRLFIIKEEKVIACAGWDGQSIRHVYVDPDKTRQGIASYMLAYVEEDYQNRSQNSEILAGVALYARPFYEANGYVFLAEETDWDGSKYYKMKKIFASSQTLGEKHV